MNEIETQRKEIEKRICISDGDYQGSCISERDCYEFKLDGFNLGVELAQKEFSDILENKFQDEFKTGNWSNQKLINELKQSINSEIIK